MKIDPTKLAQDVVNLLVPLQARIVALEQREATREAELAALRKVTDFVERGLEHLAKRLDDQPGRVLEAPTDAARRDVH